MKFQSEAFTYILKQYLKGKKDNINFILISLREFIIEKCIKYKLRNNEVKVLLKFLIHAIDTYSFEKSISFYEYIDLYVEACLETYTKVKDLSDFEIPDDEFLNIFVNTLQQSLLEEKEKAFILN